MHFRGTEVALHNIVWRRVAIPEDGIFPDFHHSLWSFDFFDLNDTIPLAARIHVRFFDTIFPALLVFPV